MLLAAHHAAAACSSSATTPTSPASALAFKAYLAPLLSHQVVRLYASGRSPGQEQVLAYLSRYTLPGRDLQQPASIAAARRDRR